MDEPMKEDSAWADRFARAAAEDVGATGFDVTDDLARGRARLRRTRLVTGAAGVLVATVVVGTAVATGGGVAGTSAPVPAGPASAASPAPPASEAASSAAADAAHRDDDPFGGLEETRPWRTGIYEVVASVLDPQRRYINYDTDSLQRGGETMGIKLGWRVPDLPGEAMIQISLSSATGPHADESSLYLGARLRERELENGRTVKVGRNQDGAFAVSHRQPDGELVWVLVDPLFGNDSAVPVSDLRINERDVIRLVQDERLDLPSR